MVSRDLRRRQQANVCALEKSARCGGFHLRTHARSPCARAWLWVPVVGCGTAGEPAPAAPRCLPFRPSPSRNSHSSLCPAQAVAAAVAQACRSCYRWRRALLYCFWAGWPYRPMSRHNCCQELGQTVFAGSQAVMNMLLQVAPSGRYIVIKKTPGASRYTVIK